MNRYFLIILALLTVNSASFSQKKTDKNYTLIIVFGEIYKSNLVDLSGNSYNNIYLLTSDKYIEPVLSSLSAKRYASMQAILDTFKTKFDVYIIRKDAATKRPDVITKILTDANYYTRGYLFSVNDEVKKRSPVNYYIVKQHVFDIIKYQAIDKKGGNYNFEQVAVLKEISQRKE